MIIEHSVFQLKNKEVFKKITIKPPIEVNNHMEHEACLSYVINGKQESYSPTGKLTAEKGEAILEKCGNFLNMVKSNGTNTTAKLVTIHLYPETLKLIYEDKLPDYLKSINKKIPKSNMIKIKGNALLSQYFYNLLFYFDNEELVDDELLILKLKELILLLAKTQNNLIIRELFANLFTVDTYNFKAIINTHLYSPITINELASLCSLSRSSFIRKFKKTYKKTPAIYFQSKRLEKAMNMLKLSSDPIGSIAYESGFNNMAHFSRLFRSKYNKSPKAFRLAQMVK